MNNSTLLSTRRWHTAHKIFHTRLIYEFSSHEYAKVSSHSIWISCRTNNAANEGDDIHTLNHRHAPNYVKVLILISFSFQNGLRQLDLSLLSQLWTLNESIQDFRKMIQENDNSPPHSSSSSNSDLNSIVSYENEWKVKNLSRPTSMSNQNLRTLEKPLQRMKIAPPAPPKQLRNNPKILKSQPVWFCSAAVQVKLANFTYECKRPRVECARKWGRKSHQK